MKVKVSTKYSICPEVQLRDRGFEVWSWDYDINYITMDITGDESRLPEWATLITPALYSGNKKKKIW